MAFGVAFEVPVAIVLLCWMGITTPEDLRKKRPYIWSGHSLWECCLRRQMFSRKRCWRYRCTACLKLAFSAHAFMSVSDGRATKITRPKPKRPSTLKTKHNRPPGRLSYEASMFDIGVNLTSSQFAKDRDDVVARAFAAGVKGMLLTGTNIHESQQALKLARRYPHCWSTAGVHPHDSSQWSPASEDAIIALANQPEVVAIGECGLDFNRNFSTPQEQERAFQAQLQIAAELQIPIFMHCRDAHERFLVLLDPRLDSLLVQYCTALPVHASKCRPVWIEGSISVLPGGFATNDAGLSYVNSYRLFQRKSY